MIFTPSFAAAALAPPCIATKNGFVESLVIKETATVEAACEVEATPAVSNIDALTAATRATLRPEISRDMFSLPREVGRVGPCVSLGMGL